MDPSKIPNRSETVQRPPELNQKNRKAVSGLLKMSTRKFKCENIKVFKKNQSNDLENDYNIKSR